MQLYLLYVCMSAWFLFFILFFLKMRHFLLWFAVCLCHLFSGVQRRRASSSSSTHTVWPLSWWEDNMLLEAQSCFPDDCIVVTNIQMEFTWELHLTVMLWEHSSEQAVRMIKRGAESGSISTLKTQGFFFQLPQNSPLSHQPTACPPSLHLWSSSFPPPAPSSSFLCSISTIAPLYMPKPPQLFLSVSKLHLDFKTSRNTVIQIFVHTVQH